jgi:hypothetical protein
MELLGGYSGRGQLDFESDGRCPFRLCRRMAEALPRRRVATLTFLGYALGVGFGPISVSAEPETGA